MDETVISNFIGWINEVDFFNDELYYTVVYALSKLEKHFKVDITDRYIAQFLKDLSHYEYKDDANLYEVSDKVVQYICDRFKTVDEFIDYIKGTHNPHEHVMNTLGLLTPYSKKRRINKLIIDVL